MPKECDSVATAATAGGQDSAEYTETFVSQNAAAGTLPANGGGNSYPYGFSGGPMTVAAGTRIKNAVAG